MSEPLFFSPKRKRVSAVEATDDIVSSNFFKSELTETAQKFELSALRTEQDPQLVRSRTRRKSSNNPPLAWSPSHQDSSFDIKSRNLSELLNARQDGKCSNEMEMDENISRLLSTSSDKDTTLSHPPIKKEESTHAWLTEDVNNFSKSCDIFDEEFQIHRSEKHGSHDKSGRLLNYSIEKSIFEMANSPSFRLGDFGTPVNHVGSPSVFDSIEYSIGNEDSIDVSPKKTFSHQIECGLSNHSLDNNTSNLFENRSPSGVYYVSDLSNNLLKVHKVRRKQSVVLPLPDLAAFDNSRSRIDVEKGSPICPPTPLRTPLWHSSLLGMTPEHAEWGPAFQNSEGPISIPLIMRQNSLEDNKLLLSQTESPRGDVLFLRDFIIDGLIGTGAFAEVYLVRTRHEADNIRQFAIKKIKRQFRSRKDRDWLLNEVKVMKKLGSKCNYIVEFIRAWQEDSYFYVQLGLASKGSLKDLQSAFVLSNKIFPDYTIWHILHDVVHGLHHIHDSGFVHLDIKPANLLIHEEGYIQIGDFGMASEVGSQEDGHEGDTRYMAPELLNFSERMCSADIFSLGLTILEISYDTQQLKENNIALPTEGLSWQHLRSGQLSIPTCRPTELKYIISDMVNPDPIARPTALRLIERIPNSDSNFLDDEVIMQVQCHPAKSTALFTNFCSISDSVKSAGDTQTLALLDRAITPF